MKTSAAQTSTVEETEMQAYQRYLASENDVIRNMAVRALPAIGFDEEDVRQALLEALVDEDPDTRADAMESFSAIAGEGDAQTLLGSLKGDPVREVKLAAVAGLARLRSHEAVPVLRALVTSRFEEEIAWEDELGDWEDWLDIQIAAIGALGQLGATEAIEDLMTAREDEFGQNLDITVFSALGQMGDAGVSKLLDLVTTGSGLARSRASQTLSSLAPDILMARRDFLVSSDDPVLRRMAVPLFSAQSDRIAKLLKDDPDADVRIAAMHLALLERPAAAVECLIDGEQKVQAAALDALEMPLAPALQSALADNMLAWMKVGTPVLVIASIKRLPDVAPDHAPAALLNVIEDKDQPLDVRVAAVDALGSSLLNIPGDQFAPLLRNSAQQVRVRALSILRDRAAAGNTAAVDLLASAISGNDAREKEASSTADHEPGGGPDVGAPKGEAAGSRNIRITPEGEIVELVPSDGAGDAGLSTLSSILQGNEPLKDADQTGKGAKQRQRRPVEGPDAVSRSLSTEAMKIVAGLAAPQIRAALLTRLETAPEDLGGVIWTALEQNCGTLGADEVFLEAAGKALSHKDPVARIAAYRICQSAGEADPSVQENALADPDALIRAEAVKFLMPEKAVNHLNDEVFVVRKAALERVLKAGKKEVACHAAETLIDAERSDTLSILLRSSEPAFDHLQEGLLHGGWPLRKAFIALDAVFQSGKQ